MFCDSAQRTGPQGSFPTRPVSGASQRDTPDSHSSVRVRRPRCRLSAPPRSGTTLLDGSPPCIILLRCPCGDMRRASAGFLGALGEPASRRRGTTRRRWPPQPPPPLFLFHTPSRPWKAIPSASKGVEGLPYDRPPSGQGFVGQRGLLDAQHVRWSRAWYSQPFVSTLGSLD